MDRPDDGLVCESVIRRDSAITLWISKSSSGLAAVILERLRGMSVDVRLWDDTSESSTDLPPDLAIGDRAFNRARVLERTSSVPTLVARSPVTTPCQGGLAPIVLRRVRDYIERELSEPINVAELARMAGLSDCHFSRAFRQSLGIPPHRYLMNRRVAVAEALIAETNRTLTDIALTVGFSDHSHFTRTFARIKGETPTACRRRFR